MKLLTKKNIMAHVVIFVLSCVIFLSVPVFAADTPPITLSIPQSLIATSVRQVLPIPLNTNVSSLKGSVRLVDISDLRILAGGLSARLRIAGENMAIKTNIGGHNLNMNVGAIELDVKSDASLRFDMAKQILYVRPTIKEAKSRTNGQVNQIGSGLAAILNGREFPITLRKIQPIVSQAGLKEIIIQTQIIAVTPRNGKLELKLLPKVYTRQVR